MSEQENLFDTAIAENEEQMTNATKRNRKSAEKSNETKTYSTTDIQAVLQTPEAQALMQAMVAKMFATQQPTVIKVEKPDDEMVTLLYMGIGVDGSMVLLNEKLGEIPVRGGLSTVPKKDFLQNRTASVLKRLQDRRLIVLDGLTDEERERYGLKYTDGELLSEEVYYRLLDLNEDKVVAIFSKACYRHKQIIASLYAEAYNKGDNRINQPLIQRLNTVSKETDPNGMFTAILKDMAKALSEEADNGSNG